MSTSTGKTNNKNSKDLNKIEGIKSVIKQGIEKESFFTGPAIYFPQEALKCYEKEFLSDRHIEMTYATLTAWGMHRLGETGAEMPDYKCFKCSILGCKEKLEKIRDESIREITEMKEGARETMDTIIDKLEDLVFNEIIASGTDSHLVASTKTLAHILPDLVPPMDRRYTAKYFGKSMQNPDQQKKMFKFVMNALWSVYQDKDVRKKALAYCDKHPYVSLPKLFDNAIIQIRRGKGTK